MHEVMEEAKSRGWVFGLDSISNLLEVLGNPQDSLNFVHVTGTNGKGSVCNLLSGVLKESGLRVGKYTSPAVGHPAEKYSVNEEFLSENDYEQYLSLIEEAAKTAEEQHGTKATAFELETALAFLYFSEQNVDLAVVEVGLGGELDATNIISNTLVSVFTPISLDHTNILGDSLEKIASAKAGIIKYNASVVSAMQEPEVCRILSDAALKKECDCLFVKDADIELKENEFSYKGKKYPYRFKGKHQSKNMALVIEIIERLREKGYSIGEDALERGFQNTSNPYRFSLINDKPEIYLDGAHNPAAIHALTNVIKEYFTNQPLTFIIGVLKDKDYETMFSEILPFADNIICVQPDNQRALALYELKAFAEKFCSRTVAADTFSKAAELALKNEQTIIAFGSFYYLSDLEKEFKSILTGNNQETK